MESKLKSEYHSESKSPSSSSPTSPECLKPQTKVARVSTTATCPYISNRSIIEPPEVQTLIHKLQGFSMSSLLCDLKIFRTITSNKYHSTAMRKEFNKDELLRIKS